MTIHILARLLDLIGKVLVSYAALAVHYRMRKEHSIDKEVESIMRKEHILGLVGIGLMVVAFVIEAVFSLGLFV